MATFNVQGPDGKTYKIEAPDQSSALSAFKRFTSQQPSNTADPLEAQRRAYVPQPATDDAPALPPPAYMSQEGDTSQPSLENEAVRDFPSLMRSLPGILETGADIGDRALETATLGLLGDEFRAGVGSALSPRAYDEALADERLRDEEMGVGEKIAGDVLGTGLGITTGSAALRGLQGVVGPAVTQSLSGLLPRSLLGAGAGVAAGATMGAMEGEGADDRAGSAMSGGLLGGLIGGAAPSLGVLGRRVGQYFSDASRANKISSNVGSSLGVSPEAAGVISDVAQAADQSSIAAILARGGDTAMLGDVPEMGVMLDASMRSATPGAAQAQNRIAERLNDTTQGMLESVRGSRGVQQLGQLNNKVRASAAADTAPKYKAAYDFQIDYETPQGAAVLDVLNRVPRKELSSALEKANREIVFEGGSPISYKTQEDGTIQFTDLPSVEHLDNIKRAFDQIAEDGKDITGAMNSDARFAASVAREVRELTKAATEVNGVSLYGEALASGAKGIRERTALREGSRLLDSNVTVEDALETIKDSTPAERELMRQGLVNQIDHTLGNVTRNMSSATGTAAEDARAWKSLSSRNTKQKLQELFGDEWPEIESRMAAADSAVELRARTASGSQTAQRGEALESINASVQPNIFQSGNPLAVARDLGRDALGASPRALDRRRASVRSEIADALTRGGNYPVSAMSSIAKALMDNPRNMQAGQAAEQYINLAGRGMVPLSQRYKDEN